MSRRALLFLSPPLILTEVDKNYWRRRLLAWRPPPFLFRPMSLAATVRKGARRPMSWRALLNFYHRHSYLQGWNKISAASPERVATAAFFIPSSVFGSDHEGRSAPPHDQAGAPHFYPSSINCFCTLFIPSAQRKGSAPPHEQAGAPKFLSSPLINRIGIKILAASPSRVATAAFFIPSNVFGSNHEDRSEPPHDTASAPSLYHHHSYLQG